MEWCHITIFTLLLDASDLANTHFTGKGETPIQEKTKMALASELIVTRMEADRTNVGTPRGFSPAGSNRVKIGFKEW